MEGIDDQLRASIHSILNSVSDDTVNDIIQAVKYAGLESFSDLQFVQEDDLMLVLKPIPRRKLVKAWSKPVMRHRAPLLPLPSDAGDPSPPPELPNNQPSLNYMHQRVSLLPLPSSSAAVPSPSPPPVLQNSQTSQNFIPPRFPLLRRPDAPSPPPPPPDKLRTCLSSSKFMPSPLLPLPASFPSAKLRSRVSSSKLKWIWPNRITLLRIYAKHRRTSSPNVDEQSVWRKIAKEFGEKCSFKCTADQCRSRIKGLRQYYEKIKKKHSVIDHPTVFTNEARKVFEKY